MPVWTAKPTKNGNSMALRLEKAMLDAYPEFLSGDFSVNVLSPKTILIHKEDAEHTTPAEDPVVGAFLDFLDTQMQKNPDRIVALSKADFATMKAAVEGIELDDQQVFDADFEVPGSGRHEPR